MAIRIQFDHRDPDLTAPLLRAEARRILAAVDRSRAELSLLLVDDVQMRVLNRDFRGIDRTTDVLSFPQSEPDAAPLPGLPDMLGDVVISAPTARRQAGRYKRTFELEVRRLLIHGVLHLLGHDHKKKGEAERMRAEERRLLAALRKADGTGPGS